MVAASSSLLSMAGLIPLDFSISIIWSSQARLHQQQAMWLVQSEMELLVFARWERYARHSCFSTSSDSLFWEFKSQIQGVCRLHQLFMPLAKTKTVWQYLLQVTSLNSNSFQDVAGAASQRLLSYKYAPTNNMFNFQRIYLKKKSVFMFAKPGTRATEIWITWLKSNQNILRQTAR